eukprot:355236-Chlamydomonas_euryale.AAC.9
MSLHANVAVHTGRRIVRGASRMLTHGGWRNAARPGWRMVANYSAPPVTPRFALPSAHHRVTPPSRRRPCGAHAVRPACAAGWPAVPPREHGAVGRAPAATDAPALPPCSIAWHKCGVRKRVACTYWHKCGLQLRLARMVR